MSTKHRARKRSSNTFRSNAPKATLQPATKSIYWSLDQELIVITVDKLLSILRPKLPNVKRWKAPLSHLGSLPTIMVTLATANFHDLLGLTGDVWKALYIVSLIPIAVALVMSLRDAKTSKSPSAEEIVGEVMSKSEKRTCARPNRRKPETVAQKRR